MIDLSRGTPFTFRQGARSALLVVWLAACASCVTPRHQKIVTPRTVTPSAASVQQSGLRRKVVIARFSNETLYGKSILLGDKDLLGRQASDMLATRITESGNFVLFERADPAPILEALDTGSIEELGLPADYLIIGSVSEFGRETKSKKGFFSRTKMQVARAKVNVRLVDVRSSRVIFASDGTGEAETEVGTVVGLGTSAGFDSTLNDKAISAAISKVVNNLLEKLLDRPWRSYVLSNQDGVVTIVGGRSQGLRAGRRFKVVERGKTVKNPQTGGLIELPGKRVAGIDVNTVHGDTPEDEISLCKIVSGGPLGANLAEYVVEEESR